jgi:hypothetical protein
LLYSLLADLKFEHVKPVVALSNIQIKLSALGVVEIGLRKEQPLAVAGPASTSPSVLSLKFAE